MAISIDGKVYDETKFSIGLRNRITARQEIEASRVRHDIELEKISVLTEFYNKGEIIVPTHYENGIESFPKAIQMLFNGGHTGKLMVKM